MNTRDFEDFLRSIVDTLESLGITYMLGGSVASSLYSEPRSTRDVDVAVVLPLEEVQRFARAFQELGYYVLIESIVDAAIHDQPFNIIDAESGYKADFFLIVEPTELERSVLTRRRRVVYDETRGAEVCLYSPEDVIIYKLKYFLSGRMDKHLRDILAMLVIQGEALDYDYIGRWAEEIGAAEVWGQILAEYRRRTQK